MREIWTVIGTGVAIIAVVVTLHQSMRTDIGSMEEGIRAEIGALDDRLRAVEVRTERLEVKLSRIEAIVAPKFP
ncbi:MAG: hypothetical protein OXE83_09910 [Gammaproteobacteria bacterium]|nr:hypothetical protein [Gammaproteobacteria bacterium]